ncbi:sensor histidine kinase [Variovorax paradoxus]|uniref:histidine kinase n=1 Tax=Variovorax paradoxus TaxID=34073 RepID=A0A679ILH9_VARPD|nr:Osmolarity sensor protein EnvZ [Variovorax paradoxus]
MTMNLGQAMSAVSCFNYQDLPLMVAGAIAIALLLATACLLVHALAHRAALGRLAAALEQREGERPRSGHTALGEGGPPAVARLARAINATRRRAAEREADQLDLQAGYAHDLRTPLTRLGLRCEMLEDDALRDAMVRDLAEMGELVEASLASARMQRSASEPPRRVDADGLLGTLVGDYRDAGRAVALEGRVGQPVAACPQALRRVLVNLIDNALRYGSDVRLCVQVDARRLVLAVVDSGPGIVPSEMEAVFAPWHRAPLACAPAAAPAGSGLGLSIARRLTVAMRGELQLQNRRSGGLEARLTLPLAAG